MVTKGSHLTIGYLIAFLDVICDTPLSIASLRKYQVLLPPGLGKIMKAYSVYSSSENMVFLRRSSYMGYHSCSAPFIYLYISLSNCSHLIFALRLFRMGEHFHHQIGNFIQQ